MAKMTPERIAMLRAICDLAAPGPWGHGEGSTGGYVDYQAHPDERTGYEPTSDYDGREPLCTNVDKNFRTFVACARAALPETLDEIARLTARVAELEGELVEWDRLCDVVNAVCETKKRCLEELPEAIRRA